MIKKKLDVKALLENALFLKKMSGGKMLCAVIKQNAYGHGMFKCARALYDVADYFAVTNIKEANELAKFAKPILILSPAFMLSKNNLAEYVVCSVNDIDVLENLCEKQKRKIFVHVKINTGMNRLGESENAKIIAIILRIKLSTNLKLKGVFTHFASSEKLTIKRQNENFKRILNLLNLQKNIIIHSENTGAVLSGNKNIGNMTRCGIGLYGGVKHIGIKPILSIKAQVCAIYSLKKGDKISYNGTFTAPRKMKVACIKIGYANGLNRKLSNNWNFYYNRKKLPIIGSICMNLTMCDISEVSAIKPGSFVTVLGKRNNIFEMAEKLETISYECFTSFK